MMRHMQVHKARLRHSRHGGQEVAVKVQYPGALQVMLQDLKNIRHALFRAFLPYSHSAAVR